MSAFDQNYFEVVWNCVLLSDYNLFFGRRSNFTNLLTKPRKLNESNVRIETSIETT